MLARQPQVDSSAIQIIQLDVLPQTDSTIAPPQTSDFLYEQFVAARYEEGCHEKYTFACFLAHEGLRTDDVGVAKGTVFQEIRSWAGFKTGDFVNDMLGGLL